MSRITDKVKLVGPTISCEGSPKDGNIDGEWRTNPHVQSYVLATDQASFGCFGRKWCCRILLGQPQGRQHRRRVTHRPASAVMCAPHRPGEILKQAILNAAFSSQPSRSWSTRPPIAAAGAQACLWHYCCCRMSTCLAPSNVALKVTVTPSQASMVHMRTT